MTLSSCAQKMLYRLKAGAFYDAYKIDWSGKRVITQTMQELIDAGLVQEGMRCVVFRTYFVPKGFQFSYTETFPEE